MKFLMGKLFIATMINSSIGNNDRKRFFIGGIRDRDRLYQALDGADYVVHAEATKIVPTAECNPFEC
jgi:UDP-N-acetylglucosamine 4,6-dehydratase